MNYRLRIIVVAVLLAGLAGGGARPTAALPARQADTHGLTTPAELETFLDGVAAAQMAGLHVAGMTVAVVKDGAPFFAKGYGYADLAARTPVDAGRTLFRAGSVSKLLVWTAVMQMVEQGQLDLDADIADYVDLPFPVTYPEPITLRHLMTHTPGFEDKGDGLFVRSAEQVHPLPEYLAGNIPARIFPPGETQAYSNYGAALAAHIVERVSGRDFNDYVEQNILQPLGMAHTTFRQPLPPELAPDLSRGYRFAGGAYEEGIFEWVQPYPAGSMSTTASDMAIFMITHLQNGRYGDARILEEATAREMHTARQRSDPRLGGWGLGFNVGEMNGVTTIGHGGDTNWFHSNLTLLPDHNVGIFVSTNTNTGAEARSELVQAFMDRYFPAAANPPASPDLGDPAAYSGTYFPARMNVSTVEKILALVQPVKVNATPDGKLAVSGLLGAGTTKWIAREPGVFAAERDDLPARSLLIFGPAPGGASGAPPRLYFGTEAYLRQPWYAAQGFQYPLMGLALVFFVGTVLAVPIGAATRRRYHLMAPEAIPPLSRGERLARLTAWVFALLATLYIGIMAGVLRDLNNVIFGAPPFLARLTFVPWLLALLAVAVVVWAVVAWMRGYWTLWGRILYTALALLGAGYVWFLWFWRFFSG